LKLLIAHAPGDDRHVAAAGSPRHVRAGLARPAFYQGRAGNAAHAGLH
jgi:hypothetical protein